MPTTTRFQSKWQQRVAAVRADPTFQELVACMRAGLSWTDARGLTRRQRLAFLMEFSQQERDAYERAKDESR